MNHEQFVWDIRVQPAILDAFAQIWGTHDLIASFDGMNVSLPLGEHGRTDIQPTPAWPRECHDFPHFLPQLSSAINHTLPQTPVHS